MNESKEALEVRVARLEQTAAIQEQRIAALELRLDPEAREQRMTADLELLLDELAGSSQDQAHKTGMVGRRWTHARSSEGVSGTAADWGIDH